MYVCIPPLRTVSVVVLTSLHGPPHLQVIVVLGIVLSVILYQFAVSAVLYVQLSHMGASSMAGVGSIVASVTGSLVQLVAIMIMGGVSGTRVCVCMCALCDVCVRMCVMCMYVCMCMCTVPSLPLPLNRFTTGLPKCSQRGVSSGYHV